MKFLVIILLASPIAFGLDCSIVADGKYEIACRSYVICTGGQSQYMECPPLQVYDSATGVCTDERRVSAPCGTQRDCTTSPDGLFPDYDNNCHSYYTCATGHYFGHNYCAGILVFNPTLQTCDWPQHTDPPCGTKGTANNTAQP